jgi:DNA (cytosine-5)-methyltransferase 1
MNELALFAGIGGGILGGLLVGHRCVCAVEIDPYCRSVLVQRQNDGTLPPFPIWDDIRTFDGREWQGVVDVVSGGFPCQDISVAGNKEGITGARSSLWFEMLRVVREIQPAYAFVENSAGLIWNGLDVVLGGLSEVGYDAEWFVLGADDVGANHRRKRCWILAYTKSKRRKKRFLSERVKKKKPNIGGSYQNVSNAGLYGLEQRFGQLPEVNEVERVGTFNIGRVPEYAKREWWSVEPDVGRVVDGISHRLDRLKGLGNAQVPLCAACAWTILFQNINEM